MVADEMVPNEDRIQSVKEYYAGVADILLPILALPHGPEKSATCRANQIDPGIIRTMLDYSRYYEAKYVEKALSSVGVAIPGLRMLDFGCLVSDYGLYFARRGASVAIYDNETAINFAEFRYAREGFQPLTYRMPTSYDELFRGRELVVFGEVLEHVNDPVVIAKACIDSGVHYMFTSCYPYGDDKYFALPGHSKKAQQQQGEFIELMETYYQPTITHDKARFWRRIR